MGIGFLHFKIFIIDYKFMGMRMGWNSRAHFHFPGILVNMNPNFH